MDGRRVWICAFLVICLCKLNGCSVNKQISVVHLTHVDWKTCLQTDYGEISPSKTPLDLGGFIHVSGIRNLTQHCGSFHLDLSKDDLIIIIPARESSKCFHFTDCRAHIITKNANMVVGNSKCYDVLTGHYWHDQQQTTVKEFQMKNMKSRGTVCDYSALDKLMQPKALTGSVNDIFSPVEDIVNNAVSQVEDFGNQLVANINENINDVQKAVTDEVSTISITVQEQTKIVTAEVINGVNKIDQKIDYFVKTIEKDAGKMDTYFHIFMHILEFIGLCVVLKIVYGLYRKAHGIYDTFAWILARIIPGHHQNANNQQVNRQNANNHPANQQNRNQHPGIQLHPIA